MEKSFAQSHVASENGLGLQHRPRTLLVWGAAGSLFWLHTWDQEVRHSLLPLLPVLREVGADVKKLRFWFCGLVTSFQ